MIIAFYQKKVYCILGVGSQVTIDGRTYTIFKMLSGVANDENAYDLLIS